MVAYTRVLRTPGFFQHKYGRFPIRKIEENRVSYQEREMLDFYQIAGKWFEQDSNNATSPTDNELRRICDMDSEHLLRALSGHPIVNGEVFSFAYQANGNKNIIVNNTPTSCFIDRHGRIGSRMKGGPTIFQWLKYYGRTNSEIAFTLKSLFGGAVYARHDS